MAETDDGVRGDFGVLVSLKDRGAAGVRIVFDRMRRGEGEWKSCGFVTFKDLTREELSKMTMSEEDLASMGLVVAAELCAFWETQE